MCGTGRFRGGPAFRNASSPQRSRRPGCAMFIWQRSGRRRRAASPNRRREWDRFWGIVEEKLARPEAELALQEAGAIAQIVRSCLLCYEADWQICHRRRVGKSWPNARVLRCGIWRPVPRCHNRLSATQNRKFSLVTPNQLSNGDPGTRRPIDRHARATRRGRLFGRAAKHIRRGCGRGIHVLETVGEQPWRQSG